MVQTIMAECVLDCARSWIGTPYHHQASLKGIGCDCLGLVRGVWREIEGQEPEKSPSYSADWSEVSGEEQLFEAARRNFFALEADRMQGADVLLFRLRRRSVAKHLGILSTDDRFIHAYDGTAVVENYLSEFWRKRIVGAFRFPSVHKESA